MNLSLKSLGMVGVGLIVPAIAAKAARHVAGASYGAITHNDPPQNPAHPSVQWKEAIAWTVFSGVLGGLARLAVHRWLATTDVPAEGDDMDDEMEQVITDA